VLFETIIETAVSETTGEPWLWC